MGKKLQYYCCICGKPIDRNNRLVHQEYDGKKVYGAFRTKKNYDFCEKHFKVFKYWIYKNNQNKVKLGVEEEK